MAPFATIDAAINAVRAGDPVVVVDDADRENEGDLVFAAERATPDLVGFTVRHTGGVICVPMPGDEVDRLQLPPMCRVSEDPRRTAFTVSVDARAGTTTGISAPDRACTIRALADPMTAPSDLMRPGHIFPLRGVEGGVLRRAGHTEAAIDLARMAGMRPVGVISEIVNPDGTMARLPQLTDFCVRHRIPLISIADLIARRSRAEQQLVREAEVSLPTRYGAFTAVGFRDLIDGSEHVALVKGTIGNGEDVLVRVHSECLTGDVFHSRRCDCGSQLTTALRAIEAEGRGVVLYLRRQEGRGIGLLSKLEAYALQDAGADTVDANLQLGLPVDRRTYGRGAQMLLQLGVRSMRLLTNNPSKRAGLEGYGLSIVETQPLNGATTPDNLAYLRAKRDRLGHALAELAVCEPANSSVGATSILSAR